MYKIEYTDLFILDMSDILKYIGITNYIKLENSIENIFELLLINPKMGKEIEFGDREIIESKYKYQIRYELVGKTISLLMIYKFKNR
ncbi:MAG: hypothetical protein Q9M94_03020 [Candidatus Gracilibacteria bacterium]|nr:hypothetical protein [Candidatus Gracilibacteria bacterium]MDQ7023575.1 hypothetical protein [Candidatus Gracilibacteria bacterium]